MIKTKIRNVAFIATATLSIFTSACSDGNAMSPSYNSSLHQQAIGQKNSVTQTLNELVDIETGTHDPIGIPQMGLYLTDRLKKLNAEVANIPPADGTPGFNVLGTLRGAGAKNILLMAHMDTVYPRGTLEKSPFRVEENRLYGPGIADAKGGVAVILHALELLQMQNFSNYGKITVLFNTDEEKGSFGSRDLIESLSKNHDFVLSFEPGGDSMVAHTSGIAYVDVKVHGKASHAGVAPLDGVNALTVAADYMLRTLDIQDLPNEKAFNWTMASAGEASNMIPPLASLRGDMRYGHNDKMLQMEQQLIARAGEPLVKGATIDVTVTRGRPAFNMTDEGRVVANQAISILTDLGVPMKITDVRAGGGSDAAYAALSGKPVVEGLGLRGGHFHSPPGMEYIEVDSIPERLYLAAQLITDLNK